MTTHELCHWLAHGLAGLVVLWLGYRVRAITLDRACYKMCLGMTARERNEAREELASLRAKLILGKLSETN